ncbi:nitroreductase [Alkaliphilus metalliredigens QYMF]|uniref:Nitroreductase n=1 Tax=Alkaliphilus metalliredigens (strain QYMF) TaxID=293826 RepID=A6TNR8_ALKMQ|nr:SagB/ThcOx family dehydrogenase [Alkaliphilus metalliredigens]ABR47836.1 nitroreductase [Alkaliphilus metalliredigens QYMF]
MTKNIGKEFMKYTKYEYLVPSDQEKELPQPPLENAYEGSEDKINLPSPDKIKVGEIDLKKAMEVRKSLRKYSQKSLEIEELGFLLWYTQGVKSVVSRPATLRTVPSAGARHALETYLLINQVEGIKPGIYRYLALAHQLVPINLADTLADKVTQACHNQEFVNQSAVTFIWVADIYRMKWRYGERGYRYIHLDAGHVCQNLYLAAEGIDSGVCAIAAFDDDEINRLIGVDGEQQFVTYIATLGKK